MLIMLSQWILSNLSQFVDICQYLLLEEFLALDFRRNTFTYYILNVWESSV